MDKLKQPLRQGLAGVILCLAAPVVSSALLPGFTGWTEMNDCFMCDSTVSFGVYENTDGDWRDDTLFSGIDRTTLAGSVTGGEGFVYLYQVINTNHVPLPFVDPATGQVVEEEGRLVNFHVLNRKPQASMFTAGGYLNAVFRDSAGNPVLGDADADDNGNAGGDGDGNYTLAGVDFPDIDNDGYIDTNHYAGQGLWQQNLPGLGVVQTPGTPSDDIAPDKFASGQRNGGDTNPNIFNPNQGPDSPSDGTPSYSGETGVALDDLDQLMAVTSVVNPITLDFLFDPAPPVLPTLGTVANFLWERDIFSVGMTSPVLFLTSNKAPVYDFGSSQSPGFPGSAGDIPTAMPAPATVVLLGLGLVGIGHRRIWPRGR